MAESHTMDKIKANIVTLFHFFWAFLLLGGAFLMFFAHWYVIFEIVMMTLTVIVNIPLKGHCPSTLLEERLRQKIDPSYSNQNSFLTTYLNKIFRTNFKVNTMNTFMVLFYIFSYFSAIWLIIYK